MSPERDAVQQASDLVPGRDRVVEPVPAAAHPNEFLCRVPAELVDQYADWTEVAAFRLVKIDDETVEIQVTRDLDILTRPATADDLVGPGSKFTGHKDHE